MARKMKRTFDALCEIAPRLRQLERRVKAVRDDGTASFCANDAWYGLRSWHRRSGTDPACDGCIGSAFRRRRMAGTYEESSLVTHLSPTPTALVQRPVRL